MTIEIVVAACVAILVVVIGLVVTGWIGGRAYERTQEEDD